MLSRDELVEFLVLGMGICGCSERDDAVDFLSDLLEAGDMRAQGHHAEADALLELMLPLEEDSMSRNLAVYWIMGSGLAEHGGTAMTHYVLTDAGRTLLAALREHGTGEELWDGLRSERVWN